MRYSDVVLHPVLIVSGQMQWTMSEWRSRTNAHARSAVPNAGTCPGTGSAKNKLCCPVRDAWSGEQWRWKVPRKDWRLTGVGGGEGGGLPEVAVPRVAADGLVELVHGLGGMGTHYVGLEARAPGLDGAAVHAHPRAI